MTRLVSIVTAVILFCFGNAATASCLSYGPTVTLNGTVVPKQFYGPPNFGEDVAHDRVDIVAVLQLDHQIKTCVVPEGETEATGGYPVNAVQMVFLDPPYGKQWNGKHVAVSGKLYPWDNALQHMPVLIMVRHVHAKAERP